MANSNTSRDVLNGILKAFIAFKGLRELTPDQIPEFFIPYLSSVFDTEHPQNHDSGIEALDKVRTAFGMYKILVGVLTEEGAINALVQSLTGILGEISKAVVVQGLEIEDIQQQRQVENRDNNKRNDTLHQTELPATDNHEPLVHELDGEGKLPDNLTTTTIISKDVYDSTEKNLRDEVASICSDKTLILPADPMTNNIVSSFAVEPNNMNEIRQVVKKRINQRKGISTVQSKRKLPSLLNSKARSLKKGNSKIKNNYKNVSLESMETSSFSQTLEKPLQYEQRKPFNQKVSINLTPKNAESTSSSTFTNETMDSPAVSTQQSSVVSSGMRRRRPTKVQSQWKNNTFEEREYPRARKMINIQLRKKVKGISTPRKQKKISEATNTVENMKDDMEMDQNLDDILPEDLSCKYCDKIFTRKSHLKQHIRIHTGEKPFKCPYCPSRFSQLGACKVHKKIHLRPYPCLSCPRSFYTEKERSRHETVSHGIQDEGKSLSVNITKSRISKKMIKKALGHNMEIKTSESSLQVNDSTGNSFVLSSQPIKQFGIKKKSMAGGKSADCPICKKTLSSPSNLKVHMSIHSSIKPYSCRYEGCTRTFKQSSNRRHHELNSHGSQMLLIDGRCKTGLKANSSPTKSPEKQPKTDSNSCNLCDFSGSDLISKVLHMRIKHNLPKVLVQRLK